MNTDIDEMLSRAKKYYSEYIIPASISKIRKCKNPRVFKKTNPFLTPFQGKLMFGDISDRSISSALVYLRLGTSLATIYGEQIQNLCRQVLGAKGFGSGFDLTFLDAIDGRRKYCQLKAGPLTLSQSAPKAITEKFFDYIKSNAKNKAEPIPLTDLIVGVTFGEHSMLSSHYKKIESFGFPIYVGKDFWHRITGEADFYEKLQVVFREAANESDVTGLIDTVVNELCKR